MDINNGQKGGVLAVTTDNRYGSDRLYFGDYDVHISPTWSPDGNILAQKTVLLSKTVRRWGVRGVIQFIRDTCKGPWLDAERISGLQTSSPQLRLE